MSKMKPAELDVNMRNAENYASLSKALRKQVGAVLVTETGVTIPGVNGTPSGTDNQCEDRVYYEPDWSAADPIDVEDNYPFYDLDRDEQYKLVTKPNVIHAELNCILKCAKEGVSTQGAVLFVTVSPCLPCSAMLTQAGIKQVYYREQYRDKSGIEELERNGIKATQLR